jgi:hypothetical protein
MKNVQALREDPSLLNKMRDNHNNKEKISDEDSDDNLKAAPVEPDEAEVGLGTKKTLYKRHEAFREFVSASLPKRSLLVLVESASDCVMRVRLSTFPSGATPRFCWGQPFHGSCLTLPSVSVSVANPIVAFAYLRPLAVLRHQP